MKKLILLVCLFTVGCIQAPIKTRSQLRRDELKGCVKEFLGEDVAALTSLKVCDTIFKRPTEE